MSGFLLDTNVPSELIRSRPDSRVEKWIRSQSDESLFISVVTIGELRRGFTLLPEGGGRDRLQRWFDEELAPLFQRRILPVTYTIADRWGSLDARCQLRGIRLNIADGMIAATALDHGLTLVTRNIKDFSHLGVDLLNPWDEA